jgi:ribonuclease D
MTEATGWVATEQDLATLIAAVSGASIAAVDTEFVREKTYYPQLCLIQIATRDHVACIDCLAPMNLEPLYAAIFRPGFTWVLHSARQDLEVVWQLAGKLPPALIDTQIAAALGGAAPQIGLENLLARALNVELGESYARTDWSRRPLPEAAVKYALDDVRYLLAAWDKLDAELRALGRRDWLDEECARSLAVPPEADTLAVWARMKGLQSLPLPAQCAGLALVRWREAAAQHSNRPRRWLLTDEELFAIAARLPRDTDALAEVMPPKFVARFGAAVVAAVATRDDPALMAEVRANGSPQVIDKNVIKGLQEQVRERATELKLEPEILATRRDLIALASGTPPKHLTTGWRAAVLAPLLPPPKP